jgi:hypothetical protein
LQVSTAHTPAAHVAVAFASEQGVQLVASQPLLGLMATQVLPHSFSLAAQDGPASGVPASVDASGSPGRVASPLLPSPMGVLAPSSAASPSVVGGPTTWVTLVSAPASVSDEPPSSPVNP